MSLREELAKRLWAVMTEPDSASIQWDESPVGILTEYEKKSFRDAADECIRQMEWARHGKPKLKPLKIAPDDWKP